MVKNNGIVRQRAVVISIVIGTMMLTSGCEPLRKKFIRKKKEADKKQEIIPILDPIEYKAAEKDPKRVYAYYFSMWQVWHKDLLTSLQERSSDKKIEYLLEEMIEQLDGMRALLKDTKQKKLASIKEGMADVLKQFQLPSAVRNNYGLRRQLERYGKTLRLEFRLEDVEKYLVDKVPNNS